MRIATTRRLCAAALLALSVSLGMPSGVLAQYHPGIKIAFHAAPVSKTPPCTVGGDLAAQDDCAGYGTAGLPLDTPLNVYVVVAGVNSVGFTGAEFGIAYDEAVGSGVDVLDWMTCGALEYPRAGPAGAWPSSGSANRILWSGCQQTVPSGGAYCQALAGVLQVTAAGDDVLKATPNRTEFCYGELKVIDCNLNETEFNPPLAVLNDLGWIGFGAAGGFTPCTGSYADATICQVQDRVLDFGTVHLGESSDLTVRIAPSGVGTGLSSFDVGPFAGGDFAIVSGEGHYEGPVQDPVDVTFRFTPTGPGVQESAFQVDPCPLCPQVTLKGIGSTVLPVERATWGEIKTRWKN